MIEWGRVPWPLWFFVVLTAGVVTWAGLQVSGPIAAQLLFGAVTVAWLFSLLSGIRWVWIVTVAFNVLTSCINLAIEAAGHSPWYQVALMVAVSAGYIGLLLLPTTCRFFGGRRRQA